MLSCCARLQEQLGPQVGASQSLDADNSAHQGASADRQRKTSVDGQQEKVSTAQSEQLAAGASEKALNGQQEKLQGTSFSASTSLTLETAMSLYQLNQSQSFWEIEQDTRCLVAWGSNTVVVAFRGTASMKNALADLQVPFVLSITLAFAF